MKFKKPSPVNVEALANLVLFKQFIEDPEYIFDESRRLYKHIKTHGYEHMQVYYKHPDGTTVKKKFKDLDVHIRAMAAFVVKVYYRWDDDNSMRLEHHFGLPTKISDILDLRKLTKSNGGEYNFISIRDLIENYLSK